MTVSNRYSWPEPLFEAIKNDPYSHDADYSVTELINPPQITALARRHEEELEPDVSELFWAACGRAMHGLLARHTSKDRFIFEKRMYAMLDGVKITGQLDFYDKETETIGDYKFVGTFAYVIANRKMKPEWEQQCNAYRWFFWKETGILADHLEIVCLLRDWMESKRYKEMDYPETQVARLRVPLWPIERTEGWLKDRIAKHQAAISAPDTHLPHCTPEERWLRNNVARRCLSYCPVRTKCVQLNGPGLAIV